VISQQCMLCCNLVFAKTHDLINSKKFCESVST